MKNTKERTRQIANAAIASRNLFSDFPRTMFHAFDAFSSSSVILLIESRKRKGGRAAAY